MRDHGRMEVTCFDTSQQADLAEDTVRSEIRLLCHAWISMRGTTSSSLAREINARGNYGGRESVRGARRQRCGERGSMVYLLTRAARLLSSALACSWSCTREGLCIGCEHVR